MQSAKSLFNPGAMRRLLILGLSLLATDAWTQDLQPAREAWREVPMPPGFSVVPTELEGPVFADAQGRTIYKWPQRVLRNGYAGEAPGAPGCFDEPVTVTAGLMSPYPPGIPLPELNNRPTCTALWPPVLAPADAEPVGEWTVIERRDGLRQWAYDEQPLYTSVRDRVPGDALGGSVRDRQGDSPVARVPLKPPPLVPPGFRVTTTNIGRMLTTDRFDAVYAYESDSAERTACSGACLERWAPVLAPALVRPSGEWQLLERSPGVRQWVFRGKPLYTHRLDTRTRSQEGSDAPGWDNVFTQRPSTPPAEFTQQDSLAGVVLADRRGRTIYVYRCGEDSAVQLACDHPDDTQVYRLAICGGGDPELCRARWPYVEAPADAPETGLWRAAWLDPQTGRFASATDAGALRVWTYRDRPVYTYALDAQPGDVHGSGTGEWRGKRNGLLAFWLRGDFMGGI